MCLTPLKTAQQTPRLRCSSQTWMSQMELEHLEHLEHLEGLQRGQTLTVELWSTCHCTCSHFKALYFCIYSCFSYIQTQFGENVI